DNALCYAFTRNKLGFIEAPEIYLSGYRVYHAFHQCGKTVKYMMSGDNGAKSFQAV
ncbi:hypothetical protein LTSEGIV_1730, partial [Salmonella enterica subsp. enterica serovar Give str. S5-487]